MITDNVFNPFFDYKITPLPWSLKCDEKSKFYISITRHSNRDTIARVSKNKTSNHEYDAKYIVHSVNILPELIWAFDFVLNNYQVTNEIYDSGKHRKLCEFLERAKELK